MGFHFAQLCFYLCCSFILQFVRTIKILLLQKYFKQFKFCRTVDVGCNSTICKYAQRYNCYWKWVIIKSCGSFTVEYVIKIYLMKVNHKNLDYKHTYITCLTSKALENIQMLPTRYQHKDNVIWRLCHNIILKC